MNFDITSLLDLIQSRKTIRNFTKQIIDDQIVLEVLEAARWSPSAQNSQPWEFVILKDREKIKKISQVAEHASILESAPLIIAVVKNMQKEDPWLAKQLAYEQSISCAGMLMLLALHELGLGGFWANVERREAAEIIGVSENVGDVAFVIACGYVDIEKEARVYFKTPDDQRRKKISESTYLNTYGQKIDFAS